MFKKNKNQCKKMIALTKSYEEVTQPCLILPKDGLAFLHQVMKVVLTGVGQG